MFVLINLVFSISICSSFRFPGLYGLLQSTGRLPNVHDLWSERKRQSLRRASPVAREACDAVVLELPNILASALQPYFEGVKKEHFRLVDVPGMPDEIVDICGEPQREFEVTGFTCMICVSTGKSKLNQIYKERLDEKVGLGGRQFST